MLWRGAKMLFGAWAFAVVGVILVAAVVHVAGGPDSATRLTEYLRYASVPLFLLGIPIIGSALLRQVELNFPAAKGFELFTGSLSARNLRLYRKHGCVVTHEQALSASVKLVFMSKRA